MAPDCACRSIQVLVLWNKRVKMVTNGVIYIKKSNTWINKGSGIITRTCFLKSYKIKLTDYVPALAYCARKDLWIQQILTNFQILLFQCFWTPCFSPHMPPRQRRQGCDGVRRYMGKFYHPSLSILPKISKIGAPHWIYFSWTHASIPPYRKNGKKRSSGS